MDRSTISLHCIIKNEKHNLVRLLSSVRGCFDEIHITDTGSSDGSIQLLEEYAANDEANPAATPIFLHHFKWVDDFAAARNYSFSHGECEYKMWLDGDDVLVNQTAFKAWRDNAMALSDYWLNTYHYGFDKAKNPICSFMRERAFKWKMGFSWRYFVHEGVVPASGGEQVKVNYVPSWHVAHMRTEVDMSMDRSRNLKMFEKNLANLDTRMKYYYGKELYEANQVYDAVKILIEAISLPDLEHHDRVLGIQYAAYGLLALGQFEKAIHLSYQGLQLDPSRAEYYTCVGDSYIKMGAPQKAIPAYAAAANCHFADPSKSSGYAGFIFSAEGAYTDYPTMQIARIKAQSGDTNGAIEWAQKAVEKSRNPQARQLLAEVLRADEMSKPKKTADIKQTDEIVITCHPSANLYEWDEQIAEEKGVGGSETAAIYMAKYLAKHSGRKVKVFNSRTQSKTFGDVEYISNSTVLDYLYEHKPFLNVAWRHTSKVTEAPTIVWAHDLITPGVDRMDFDKMVVLSPFHREYANSMQSVSKDKMYLSRNGIEPIRFIKRDFITKIPGKVIFSSSPDRGLDHAMLIMDEVVKVIPEATLHTFYGFENMRKFGMGAQADKLEKMMAERPYVISHGLVKQEELTQHFMEAECWLYPADFIETSCITALEAACAHCWPVTRKIGALETTVGQFEAMGMATTINEHPKDFKDKYVAAVIDALKNKKWALMDINPEDYSWEKVAIEWVKHLNLKLEAPKITLLETAPRPPELTI